MFSSTFPSRRGFTLLEVVAALAVIALVAVSALATVAQQLNVATRAMMISRAQELADQRYISLRLLSSTLQRTIPDSAAHGRFAPPNDDFTWQITQKPVLNEVYLNDVLINVHWVDGNYTLRTRIYAPASDTLP